VENCEFRLIPNCEFRVAVSNRATGRLQRVAGR
jgi:hypothetical protein